LPKTSKVEGRSLIPASPASFDWSISSKNRMPLSAMSFLRREIVSAIENELFTLTMPSSSAALVITGADKASRSASEAPEQALMMRVNMRSSLRSRSRGSLWEIRECCRPREIHIGYEFDRAALCRRRRQPSAGYLFGLGRIGSRYRIESQSIFLLRYIPRVTSSASERGIVLRSTERTENIMSNKIAMALLIALGAGAASSASAAVSAPWPPPTTVQTAHPVPGYGYSVTKGKRQRTNQAPPIIGEAHGSR
jgi:hypothetical protein